MTTAYTSLLGLALPVTGELSGTWGDTVNNSITSLLDSAIAGTTTLSSDADVTLTTTTGASNTSRQAILLWTAGGTVTRNITAPAQSKIYTVINKSSSTQSIVLRGVGPTTGVTIVKDESAVCAWNGSDFIKISNTSGAGAFTTLSVTGVATFSAGTAALPAITTTGDTNTGIWFPAADTIAFTEGGVESMRIDASGRLAIGSTSVTNGTAFGGGSQVNVAKIASTGYPCFQISTTTGGGSSLQFTNSDTVNGVIGYNASGGTNEFGINNALSGALTLSTNNTERARIDSSGNLGIGTSSPTCKLQVSQTGAATSLKIDGIENPIEAARYAANGDGATIFLAKSRNATVGSQTIVQNGDEIGVLKARGSNGSNFIDAGSIVFAVDGTPGAGNDMPGRIVFNTTPDGSGSLTERMRLDSSGNLGIGTSSPSGKLDVRGTVRATPAAVDQFGFQMLKTGTSTTIAGFYQDTTNNGVLALYNTSAQQSVALSGASANALILDASGNLLVGTSSLLGVSNTGTTHIAGGGSSTNQPSLYLRNPSSTAGRYWKTGPTQDAGFIIYNDSDAGQYMSYGGTTWNSSSDERNKTDLIPISNAVAKVVTLRAVTGRYISDEEGTSRSFLIAQDVQAVLPEAVDVQNNEQGTLGLAYTAVVPLLVAAIKEQSALITQLTARITALEGA